MVSTSIERIDTEKGALVLANGHVIHLEPPEDCRLLFQAGDQCSYAQNSSIFEIGVVRKIRFMPARTARASWAKYRRPDEASEVTHSQM